MRGQHLDFPSLTHSTNKHSRDVLKEPPIQSHRSCVECYLNLLELISFFCIIYLVTNSLDTFLYRRQGADCVKTQSGQSQDTKTSHQLVTRWTEEEIRKEEGEEGRI